MAWRYQASKFKNTAPKLPKKEDTIFDLPIGTLSCTDNGIQAGSDFLAFHIEGDGGKLGVVPVGTKGRKLRKDISIVHAHGEMINDFSFMPFADELLVTCSRDDKVKVWRLSASSDPVLAAEMDLGNGRLIEALKPHSTASNIVAFVSSESAFITDIEKQSVYIQLSGINDKGQSLDWSEDGRLLAISSDKGREISMFDPRSGSTPIVTFASHAGLGREGRVLFVGDRLLSSGFTNKRIQEVRLWDAGKWTETPLHIQEFVSTTGVLIPHYDSDTRLVFLSGKGTNKLFLLEQQDRQPHLSWVTELTLPEQTLGACIGSKRRVAVMEGEVDTYYQLTKTSVIPVPCIVPRRTYRDFHAELFPDTRGAEAACTGAEWLSGANGLPPKISLAPAGKSSPPPQEPTPSGHSSLMATGLAAIKAPASTRTFVKIESDEDGSGARSTSRLMDTTNQQIPTKAEIPKRIQAEVEEPTHFYDPFERIPTKDSIPELDYDTPQLGGESIARKDPIPKSVTVNQESTHVYERFERPKEVEKKDEVIADPSTSASVRHVHPLPSGYQTEKVSVPSSDSTQPATPANNTAAPTPNGGASSNLDISLPNVVLRRAESSATGGSSNVMDRIRMRANRQRPKSCVVGQIASKYRHVETLAGIKANNGVFSNLRNVNTRLSPECNGACASGQFIAVPLSGPAGVIGIYDVEDPCKLPDGVMDGIFNKAQVTDLQWSPFDDEQLAVGTDSGMINIWRLTRADGPRNEKQPEKELKISGEKIVILRWHPLAAGLLAVALSDSSIQLWDVNKERHLLTLPSHKGGILAMAWSASGRRLATLGKDFKLTVHNLNNPLGAPLYERAGVLESPRAARVLFACDDRLIVVVGLTRGSNRQVQLFDAGTTDLRPIYQQTIDNATQPLIPHYDYDSNIIFLTGKGDRTINMFELTYDSPYLLPLSNFTAPTGSQAIAYHNKKSCNVMAVEFQVAWRLTEKTMERLIFRVPRVKKDVFQSDIFPDALVTWRPVMTAEEWVNGSDREPEFESLKPDGIQHLASATTGLTANANGHTNGNAAPPNPTLPSPTPRMNTSKKTLFGNDEPAAILEPDKKEIEESWSSRITKDTKLEQDDFEGMHNILHANLAASTLHSDCQQQRLHQLRQSAKLSRSTPTSCSLSHSSNLVKFTLGSLVLIVLIFISTLLFHLYEISAPISLTTRCDKRLNKFCQFLT